MLTLALYQPDQPQNTGAMLRLCACLGLGLDIIEPMGFVWDEARVRRVAMDYRDHVMVRRHANWDRFCAEYREKSTPKRIILLTTKTSDAYDTFAFRPDDILLVGRESAGVPDDVHATADARITIPMQPHCRSLNVAMAAGIVAAEAVRQMRLSRSITYENELACRAHPP
jgi:tRNA (cytidine/uridine-2'-O-)-methyltransferase